MRRVITLKKSILTLIDQILTVGNLGFEALPLVVVSSIGSFEFLKFSDEFVFFFVDDRLAVLVEEFS